MRKSKTRPTPTPAQTLLNGFHIDLDSANTYMAMFCSFYLKASGCLPFARHLGHKEGTGIISKALDPTELATLFSLISIKPEVEGAELGFG